MKGNKVENPKQAILPNEENFNDEDILNDVLTSLKHLSTMYGTLKQEASNKKLVNEVDSINKDVGDMARDSFNLMFKKGWYPLEQEDSQKITEEYQKFSSKKKQLENK
ncbi:MAG: spore coat protein [Bacilli bacterium]|nr:spore coat protein [Bacilli bacterium]MDD4733944.1 spore coat protein [Bacilli bacterium]